MMRTVCIISFLNQTHGKKINVYCYIQTDWGMIFAAFLMDLLMYFFLLSVQGLLYVNSLKDERKGKRTETETLEELDTPETVIYIFFYKLSMGGYGV